jgi:hypothetical protein
MAMRPPQGLPYVPIGGLDLPPTILKSHVFCVGATRSGKNLSLIDPLLQALLPHFRALVLDVKRSDYEIIRGILPASRISNLHPIDAGASAWDLEADLRAPLAIADAVYALIPDAANDGTSRFFDSSARNTTEAAIGVFVCKEVVARLQCLGRHWDLRDLLNAIDPQNLRALLRQTDRGRRAIRTTLENAATSVDREQDIIASIASHIERFSAVASALHRHNVAGRRFSINKWADGLSHETCVRIALDERYKNSLHPYVGWEISYALRRLLGRDTRKHEIDTVIFLNEVQSVVQYLGPIAEFLTTASEKGCAVIAATQSFSALNEAATNPRAAQVFLDNSGTQVFYRTDSREVAEAASKLFGQQEVARWQPTYSLQDTEGSSRTVADTEGSSFGESHGEGGRQGQRGASFSRSVSHSPSRSRSSGESTVVARQFLDLAPPDVFLNMRQFSFERGVDCAVRSMGNKWAVTISPEWLANRTPVRVPLEENSLDPYELFIDPWSKDEENAFLGDGPSGIFDHIARPDSPADAASPTAAAGGGIPFAFGAPARRELVPNRRK